MNANIAAIIGMVLFGYVVAANGAYMLISPISWEGSFWTAKGIHTVPLDPKQETDKGPR